MVPLDQGDLTSELQQYAGEFAAVKRDGESLVDGLSEAHIAWHENGAGWSIGDCLSHLAVTFRLTIGQELALTAAHERRHLWQAWRVRRKVSLLRDGSVVE